MYLMKMFDRLGIADQLKPKLIAAADLQSGRAGGGERRSRNRHDADQRDPSLCGRRSGRAAAARIELTTVFPAAVGAHAKEPRQAKALIKFLTSPAAAPVLKAKGLEPG